MDMKEKSWRLELEFKNFQVDISIIFSLLQLPLLFARKQYLIFSKNIFFNISFKV